MKSLPRSAFEYSMLSKTLQIGAIVLLLAIVFLKTICAYAHVDLVEIDIAIEAEYNAKDAISESNNDGPRDSNGNTFG